MGVCVLAGNQWIQCQYPRHWMNLVVILVVLKYSKSNISVSVCLLWSVQQWTLNRLVSCCNWVEGQSQLVTCAMTGHKYGLMSFETHSHNETLSSHLYWPFRFISTDYHDSCNIELSIYTRSSNYKQLLVYHSCCMIEIWIELGMHSALAGLASGHLRQIRLRPNFKPDFLIWRDLISFYKGCLVWWVMSENGRCFVWVEKSVFHSFCHCWVLIN